MARYDIYSATDDDLWRFTLGKAGRRPLVTIGLNPSTATQEASDTTVAKVEGVAARQGFDGFIMLNLYPVRATDFRTLPAEVNRKAYDTNLDRIEQVVQGLPGATVWAGWGDPVMHHPYFGAARDELFRRLAAYGARWVRYGDLTAKGHPRHPSRLQYQWTFSEYAPA